jgi:hypothetical protein
MKEFLSKNGIRFVERDVVNDLAAIDELHAMGFYSLPVTMIAHKAVPGFNPDEIIEALHRTIEVPSPDPTRAILLIERAMVSVERAIRQMPDEKMDWSIPQRQRPMREFTYHIFSHVLSIIEEGNINKSAESRDITGGYASFRDIADYGRSVTGKYRAWASKQEFSPLRTSLPVESKVRAGAERLDVAAGAIIHHLRQLYSILENLGITPENRVDDGEWPSEYVLTTLW